LFLIIFKLFLGGSGNQTLLQDNRVCVAEIEKIKKEKIKQK